VSHNAEPDNEDSIPPSQWVNIDGLVHYVDYGGPGDGPRLVLVHGLGGSLVSWAAVAPALARIGRVIAIDLAGFGRTPGSPRPVTLVANQRLLHRFLTQVTGTPAIIIGHSMGGTIAAMLSAKNPSMTAGLIFIDPAVPWQFGNENPRRLSDLAADLAQATVTPGQARRQGKLMLEQAMRLAKAGYARASQLPPGTIERNLQSVRGWIEYGQKNGDMLAAAQSLTLTVSRRRQFSLMLQKIKAPVLMLHGDRDRFVPISAARATARAHPVWHFEVAEGVGHVPQLEVPQWTIDRIVAWLEGEGAEAVRQARTARRPSRDGMIMGGPGEDDGTSPNFAK
jgi:pimeloyl-ACP methyl ester carboxylesterase